MLAVAAGIGAILWLGRSPQPTTGAQSGRAPDFTLTSTDGRQVSLSDYRGRDVLLYFSEGVGCDACFYQMADLEKHSAQLSASGLTVLPIVVNPVSDVRAEEARFGIRTPFLIDADEQVSNAYGVVGTGMHSNLPGHSFVLVDGSGDIRWRGDFPSMFVRTSALLTDMGFTT